jgi:hypothetical protein
MSIVFLSVFYVMSGSAPSSPIKGSPSKLPFSQRMIKASGGPLTNASVRSTDNPKSALGFEHRGT